MLIYHKLYFLFIILLNMVLMFIVIYELNAILMYNNIIILL
jgi:hypothetical protein